MDFWAPWCGPCKRVAPILDEISEEMGDKVEVVKINVDENPQTAADYRVVSIPTMILFKNSEVKNNIVGLVPKNKYKKMIEENL